MVILGNTPRQSGPLRPDFRHVRLTLKQLAPRST
jgi:hypothetical protein